MSKIHKILWALWLKLTVIPGWHSFKIKDGSRFRVTGFYYIYRSADGERRLIQCPRIFANALGGYGVCGWYTEFENIESIELGNFKIRWHFIRRDFLRMKWRKEWKRFIFFYRLPQGLTEDELWDLNFKEIMKNIK